MNLDDLRLEIDRVDEGIVNMLAQRFRLTESVGQFKAENKMEALSSIRESEQFKRFEQLSKELDIPYEVVEKIFKVVRDQVILNHEYIRSEYES